MAPASINRDETRPSGPGWTARNDGTNTVLALSSDWTARTPGIEPDVAHELLGRGDVRSLRFDATQLGRWDSSLLVFLSSLRQASAQKKIEFDESGLPLPARRLLLSQTATRHL